MLRNEALTQVGKMKVLSGEIFSLSPCPIKKGKTHDSNSKPNPYIKKFPHLLLSEQKIKFLNREGFQYSTKTSKQLRPDSSFYLNTSNNFSALNDLPDQPMTDTQPPSNL
ncbi:hypothetical protein NPIL_587881 [Nephila pilipes]|uniref:Uncharacterized protein n=1 Tax=Nephila pilipes TaxID=299642 RepID=A0A8X6QDI0_NEPPI|nr:hypothetical protein NPIL_587881 [Nephila pilipes]